MVTLRPFKSDDLSALYAISLATGHQGGDASSLYTDARLIGHIYSAPYALLASDQVIVADDDDGVAGFVAGVADTSQWEERLELRWWPKLRREYIDPGDTPRAAWTADQRRAFMIHHPERTPQAVARTYPAHLHINLLARMQRRGVGSALLKAWIELTANREPRGHPRPCRRQSPKSWGNPILGSSRLRGVDVGQSAHGQDSLDGPILTSP